MRTVIFVARIEKAPPLQYGNFEIFFRSSTILLVLTFSSIRTCLKDNKAAYYVALLHVIVGKLFTLKVDLVIYIYTPGPGITHLG